jgi:hypothetical protein
LINNKTYGFAHKLLQTQGLLGKVVSVPRAAVAGPVGRCDDQEIGAVDDALRHWLALA